MGCVAKFDGSSRGSASTSANLKPRGCRASKVGPWIGLRVSQSPLSYYAHIKSCPSRRLIRPRYFRSRLVPQRLGILSTIPLAGLVPLAPPRRSVGATPSMHTPPPHQVQRGTRAAKVGEKIPEDVKTSTREPCYCFSLLVITDAGNHTSHLENCLCITALRPTPPTSPRFRFSTYSVSDLTSLRPLARPSTSRLTSL
jgi:hypothetical protein